jgi:hypothetical protein
VKSSFKIVKFEAHLAFHNACKEQGLTPSYFKFKFQVNSDRMNRIIHNFYKQLLAAKISEIITSLRNLRHNVHNLRQEISYHLNDEIMVELQDWISRKGELLKEKKMLSHRNKLQKLGFIFQKEFKNLKQNAQVFVKNLSNKSFTEEQLLILSLSPQFNLSTVKKNQKHLISSQVESMILSCDENIREPLRNRIINCPIPKNSNPSCLPRNCEKIITELKKDKDIHITQADKGNLTVILNAADYKQKMMDIVSDEDTYKKVSSDPTNKIEKLLNTKLKKYFYPLVATNKNRYKFLLSTNGAPPMLYGLPKVHKPPKFPCRPIVDFNPSPLKNLSQFLNSQLSPMSGKLNSHIKNSAELKEQIMMTKLTQEEELVSFDVVSLYSSIPYDVALRVCASYVGSEPDFESKSKMKISHFMDLLDFCLKNTYFIYDGEFYLQIKGLPMGAAISVTVANLVMETLESEIFMKNPDLHVRFFKRYIDDILCALLKRLIEVLLHALNSWHKDIQFTVEKQVDNMIPYLDTQISKLDGGKLGFTVYRKPTHTGRYLEYFSANPTAHKKSVVSSLFHRAATLCDNQALYETEKSIILRDLLQMGYPKDFVLRAERDVIKKRSELTTRLDRTSETVESKDRRVCLPYVRKWSENIGRICKTFSLDLTHRPINKMRFQWGNHKTYLPIHRLTNAIYLIKCNDCELVYVGETNNAMRRLKEHETDYRLKRIENSALADHSCAFGHSPDFDSHSVLANDGFYLTRKLSESFFIQDMENTLNKHPGSLPPIYLTSDFFKLISN